jgi:hypothetical protein
MHWGRSTVDFIGGLASHQGALKKRRKKATRTAYSIDT